MSQSFTGKIVLVTGSSRGIGAEIATAFAEQGAKVVLHGRDQTALANTQARLQQSGAQVLSVTGEVSQSRDLEGMRQQIQDTFGGLDILVANAGGNLAAPGPFEQLSEEAWNATLNGNLTATFLTIKTLLPLLKAGQGGSIITLSSSAARMRSARSPLAYAVAKAGIQVLTQHLAAELGPDKLRVNCIAPGTVMTERNQQRMPPEMAQQLAAQHPIRRLGTPSDIAQATLFLASEEAQWITGVVLDVNGGFVMVP